MRGFDQEKPQVYSWAYSEELFGPSAAQLAADLALQRIINIREASPGIGEIASPGLILVPCNGMRKAAV
jgi:hypothetical protein